MHPSGEDAGGRGRVLGKGALSALCSLETGAFPLEMIAFYSWLKSAASGVYDPASHLAEGHTPLLWAAALLVFHWPGGLPQPLPRSDLILPQAAPW